MAPSELSSWSDELRQILGSYDEPLLKKVASKLFRPRSQWPTEELIERSLATLQNVAVIDRRLDELGPAPTKLLALMGHSRQPQWALGNLIEMLAALGHAEGTVPAFTLFEAGLLYPCLKAPGTRLKSFEQWLSQNAALGYRVFAPPPVTARAQQKDLGFPPCPGAVTRASQVRHTDGLEWPLRLASFWQMVRGSRFRQTMQGGFFKRDQEKLRADPLINAPFMESAAPVPDSGRLAVALARFGGLLSEEDAEIRAEAFPADWQGSLQELLVDIFSSVFRIDTWNPRDGAVENGAMPNPYPSAYLLALLLISRLPGSAWAAPERIEQWVVQHHPYWGSTTKTRGGIHDGLQCGLAGGPIVNFLLGLAFTLTIVEAAVGDDGAPLVRLGPLGRHFLGLGPLPPPPPKYPKTLLVQPNLEIVAYRQGMTPVLIASLSVFANWKSLGAACTLQLQPESIYRALEAGWTFDKILQVLEQHGMRPTPPAVIELLRTWANKRERLSIYPSAALLEFASPQDLEIALARGLAAERLSDRLLAVATESSIDFRQFRLNGTRDYGLPPDQCVSVGYDGVTLTIDSARSDLLLATELRRFSEPLNRQTGAGLEQYRVTPLTLASAVASGLDITTLEEWFVRRTGKGLPPALRFLLTGAHSPPFQLDRPLILRVETSEIADGLMQWPTTRPLIKERLGPTALVVSEDLVEALKLRLQELGISISGEP
jgi:hypothetical protein